MRSRRWPTLPRSLERSTIGAVGLNDRVRNGNGCGPYALTASKFDFVFTSAGPLRVFATRTDEGCQRWQHTCDGVDSQSIGCEQRCSTAEAVVVVIGKSLGSWCSACSCWIWSSQAARAIRTAALGVGCPTSTGGLSTGWSLPALQRSLLTWDDSSWGVLPT